MVWLERYLEGDERPGLSELLNAHLSASASAGPEWIVALEAGLRSNDPLVVEGAAASLVESFGADVVEDLVDHALESSQAVAVVRALTRLEQPPERAVRRLVKALAPRALEANDARGLLRLCALAHVDRGAAIACARRTPADGPLEAELLAAEERTDDERVAALLDLDRTGATLEALSAHRRALGSIDPRLLQILPRRGTRRFRQMLTILPREHDFSPSTARAAALRADLGFGASPDVLARALDGASGASKLAATLTGSDDASVIARDGLRSFARRIALDVATARAQPADVSALAQVAVLLEGAGPPEPVLLEIASDGDMQLRALLAGDTLDGTLDLADLPPFVRAAVERATGYDLAPDMRTLLDHVIRLRAVPLFGGLTAEQLADLAPFVLERVHGAGDVIVREGERGDELHVVLEGEVAIRHGGAIVAVLRPPSCFGELALFDGAPRSATAIAATSCRLLSLDGDAVRRAGRRDPALYEAFLRVMSQQLREARVTARAT